MNRLLSVNPSNPGVMGVLTRFSALSAGLIFSDLVHAISGMSTVCTGVMPLPILDAPPQKLPERGDATSFCVFAVMRDGDGDVA